MLIIYFKSSGRGNFWCQKLHKNATPLIVTAVLNSTRAALTRATHSDRRPLDTVSLSTACSNLRMGCICYYYQINNCTVPQGRKNMKKRLGMKAINATHTQARTIITVLDFLLAQNTPPVALWACRRRFFAPRDSARPEIR